MGGVAQVLLSPHISEKNVAALSEVVLYLGAPRSMSRFTSEPSCFLELGKMAEALRNNGIPVEVRLFEDEGHGFRNQATQIEVLKETEAFFRHQLGLAEQRI